MLSIGHRRIETGIQGNTHRQRRWDLYLGYCGIVGLESGDDLLGQSSLQPGEASL